MDHKVSKDMISSGMIPSGEKTQADLGRTQYGSTPSPSKLMDAYKSMYEHHKKDADGNTIPHEGEELNEGKIPAGLQAYLDKKKGKKEDKKDVKEMIERIAGMPPAKPKAPGPAKAKAPGPAKTYDSMKGQIADRKKEVASEKDAKRERIRGIMDKMGESADLFDIVSTYFIEEGYDKKDVYEAMSSVDLSEEVQDIHEAIPLIGAALAGAGKLVAGLGAKAAATGAGKMIASKGIGAAAKKGTMMVGKKLGGTTGAKIGARAADAFGKMDNFSKLQAVGMAKDTVGGVVKAPAALAKSLTPPPIQKKQTVGTISADADLFDIVKGQLLDEGLSEEEIKDIMLTLTPDEIMEELSDIVKRNDAINKARAMERAKQNQVPDKVREASKRQYTAGGPKDTGANKYTIQDKKTIIDYNKNK